MNNQLKLKKAEIDDAKEIATLFKLTRKNNLPYLPQLHTPKEDLEFFKKAIKNEYVVLAQIENKLIGFCSFNNGWLNHLYVLPAFQGQGVGGTLLRYSKARNKELNLWVFQKNNKAISFYEKNGFKLVMYTDGSANEEKEPDAHLVWHNESM
jgi:GNAT superfamily N-acetyltransferase